jgi:hypothetical protein
VLRRIRGGAHHEAPAVEVDNDGEPLAVRRGGGAGGEVGEVEARPQARGRVNGDVPEVTPVPASTEGGTGFTGYRRSTRPLLYCRTTGTNSNAVSASGSIPTPTRA